MKLTKIKWQYLLKIMVWKELINMKLERVCYEGDDHRYQSKNNKHKMYN